MFSKNLSLLFTIIACVINATNSQLSTNISIEQTLVTTLLSGYNRAIRPSFQVNIYIGIQMKQIVSLDEKNQILTSSLFIEQWWNDPRLKWYPTSYNNLQTINILLKNIWAPDTNVLNSASGDGFFKINTDFSYSSLKYDGSVYTVFPALSMQTKCALDVRNYPYDSQKCSIILTSWTFTDLKIQYNVSASYINLGDYTPHSVWNLYNQEVVSALSPDYDAFDLSNSTLAVVNFYISRQSLYYMMNSVFPCFILNGVTILTFFMPFGNGLGLAATGFMTFAVYSLRIASDLPVQSLYLPKISWYFLTSISFSLISMFWFVYQNRCISKSEMPNWLTFLGEKLKRFFCLCFQANKDEIKEEERKSHKCKLCDRCKNCDKDFCKDEEKKKKKKTVEGNCEAINYFLAIIIIIALFITQMAIWVSVNK